MKRKQIILLITLGAVLFSLLIVLLLGRNCWGWFDDQTGDNTTSVPDKAEAGEGYDRLGNVIVFPLMSRSEMYHIGVKNFSGDNYYFQHVVLSDNDYFRIGTYVEGENGELEMKDYNPSITGQIQNFKYETLYDATIKTSQLITTIGSLTISDRNKPKESDLADGKMTAEFLSDFGLAKEDNPAVITIIPFAIDERDKDSTSKQRYYYTYNVAEGEEKPVLRLDDGKYYYIKSEADKTAPVSKLEQYKGTAVVFPMEDPDNVYTIYVGNKTIDDSGYYLYIAGRNVVYSTDLPNMKYVAEEGLEYFVYPRLVTATDENSSYKYTPGFSIENGEFVDRVGEEIPSDWTVGVTIGEFSVWDSDNGIGVSPEKNVFKQFDLSDKANAEIAALLSGARIGDTVDLLLPMQALAIGGSAITYRIDSIVGVYRGCELIEVAGTQLTASDTIVIKYKDGTLDREGKEVDLYGVLTLDKAPEELRAHFMDAEGNYKKVGDVINAEEDILYSGYNQDTYSLKYEIVSIDSITDKDGKEVDKVTYGTKVRFTYTTYEEGEVVEKFRTMVLDIPEEGTGEGQFDSPTYWLGEIKPGYEQDAKKRAYINKSIAAAILLRAPGTGICTVTTDDVTEAKPIEVDLTFAIEFISDYVLYKKAKIDQAIQYEENLSFAFKNDRELFYDDALYAIDSNSKQAGYSLDWAATNEVIALFEDLYGDETVAVGLDAETLRGFGKDAMSGRDNRLYAYRLTYTMPFGIYSEEHGDKTYYYSKSDITYTMYASEIQRDGSRYIASDQYDVVVKIKDGSKLDFLEWSFYEDWVQTRLLSTGYEEVRRLIFDLNFTPEEGYEDFDRVWAFDLAVDKKYQYVSGTNSQTGAPVYDTMARLYAALVTIDSLGKDEEEKPITNGNLSYDQLQALLTYNEPDYNPTTDKIGPGKFIYETATGTRVETLANGTYRDLDAIYGYEPTPKDKINLLGVTNMRHLLQLLYVTHYGGEVAKDLTEAEKQDLKNGEYTMRLALTLWDDEENREYGYTLTFYNYGVRSLVVVRDERRAQQDPENYKESDLFYVQSREVRRIAAVVVALTRGETIDPEAY